VSNCVYVHEEASTLIEEEQTTSLCDSDTRVPNVQETYYPTFQTISLTQHFKQFHYTNLNTHCHTRNLLHGFVELLGLVVLLDHELTWFCTVSYFCVRAHVGGGGGGSGVQNG
jgi:hypothetical protein